jgi:hypothetical protein
MSTLDRYLGPFDSSPASRDEHVEIERLAALYGHIIDARRWDFLDQVYTEDAIYDGSATGSARHDGLAAIVHYLSTSEQPSAHHASNVCVWKGDDNDRLIGIVKYFVIRRDMSIASGYYEDKWTQTVRGWRLQERSSHQLSTAKKSSTWPPAK